MNVDNRRLDRLREGQGEIANHVIDEFVAGRLSRRDFLRRGTVVGISLPVLGAVLVGLRVQQPVVQLARHGHSSSGSAPPARPVPRSRSGSSPRPRRSTR